LGLSTIRHDAASASRLLSEDDGSKRRCSSNVQATSLAIVFSIRSQVIVAEFGRALAFVKVTSHVNGNTQLSGSRYPKIVSAIKMKFGTIIDIRWGTEYITHIW